MNQGNSGSNGHRAATATELANGNLLYRIDFNPSKYIQNPVRKAIETSTVRKWHKQLLEVEVASIPLKLRCVISKGNHLLKMEFLKKTAQKFETSDQHLDPRFLSVPELFAITPCTIAQNCMPSTSGCLDSMQIFVKQSYKPQWYQNLTYRHLT